MTIADQSWVLVAVFLPLIVGAGLVAAGRGRVAASPAALRIIAVLTALVTAAAATGAVITRGGVDVSWIPALGVRFDLGIDGLSAPLILLTAAAGLIAVALPFRAPAGDDLAGYYGDLLLIIGACLLVFTAGDAVLLFIAVELVLLPMWALIRGYGYTTVPGDRDRAATRFLLVTAVGSTLMLVGILALATRTGTTDLSVWASGVALPAGGQTAIAAVLLLGLAIKTPVWPLHPWLPVVHSTAPTAGSVLLAAVLLKIGVYGMVRLVVGPLPDGFAELAPVLAALAVVGILWAGLVCLVERDLTRLVAWSSIAHLGFVVLALASGTATGAQAAIYGLIGHGAVVTLLFVVVGELRRQWGGTDLATVRAALREAAPRLGFGYVVGVAAAMGVPGLALFWVEFGAVYAAWVPAADRTEGWFRLFAVLAAVGAVLTVAAGLRMLREVWSGDRVLPALEDLRRVRLGIVALLVIVVVALGVYPIPLLELTEPAIELLLGGRS